MSTQHYPPIPGKLGHRGRPSLEEMDARKAYWKAVGGPPKSVLSPSPVSSSVSSTSAPKQQQKEEINFGSPEEVPENIQKIIDACPIILTKEDHAAIKDILKLLPPSRRGRPSKEEQIIKDSIKKKINSFIVDRIKSSNGGGIFISKMVDVEEKLEDDQQQQTSTPQSSSGNSYMGIATSGKIHQFKFGDQVRTLGANMEGSEMGIVYRHDIGSVVVFVHWKNGIKNWRCAENLIPFRATKKEIEEFMAVTSKQQQEED